MTLSVYQQPKLPDNRLGEIRVETLLSGLRSKVLRPVQGLYGSHYHLLLAESGCINLRLGETMTESEAPVAAIFPPAPDLSIELSAGTSGWLIGLPPALWAEVVGSGPESNLMTPQGSNVILAREFRPNATPSPAQHAATLLSEIQKEMPGAQLAAIAHIRLILLEIWRNARIEPAAPGHGSDLHTLERFRRVVEVNFRKHMTIAEYAEILGVTQSRLRRICQRSLDHSPLELVHMRLMREAATWLEHSGQSVKEIALAMGFGDATEFSHFFKRHAQMSPREYRQQLTEGHEPSLENTSLADWP